MNLSYWTCVAALLPVLYSTQAVVGQPPNGVRSISGAVPGRIDQFVSPGDADDSGVLAALNKSGKIRRMIDPTQLDKIPEPSDRSSVRLSDAIELVRKSNTELYQSALRASSAFSVKPELYEVIAETDETFVVASGVKLLVKDPAAFAAISPEFRATLDENSRNTDKLEMLPADQRQKIEKFLTEEAFRLPDGHPLADAARRGNAALFEAIQQGIGDFSVTETITIAKQPLPMKDGRVVYPDFDRGLMDLNKFQSATKDISELNSSGRTEFGDFEWIAERPAGRKAAAPAPEPVRESTVAEGETNYRDHFLTGFTIGNGWQWEKTWDFRFGYFRISMGAGYEYGMRFPLKFDGTVTPTSIKHYGVRDKSHSISSSLQMTPFDGDADFYHQIGVPQSLVYEGKEFLLGASAYYNVKLRAFGATIVNRGDRFGFDAGRNLRPPGPGRPVQFRLEIPPEVTGTQFDLWALSGSAQFGLLAELEGEASITSSLMVDRGVVDNRSMTLAFNRNDTLRFAHALDPLALANGERSAHQRYGIRLSNPEYRVSASLTPSVRGQLRSHVPGFRKRFNTAWINLNRFRFDLGEAEFTAHRGTRRHRDFNIGTREFHRLVARPSLPESASPGDEIADTDVSEAKPRFRPPVPGKIKLPKKSEGAVKPIKELNADKEKPRTIQ
jgi:hypothetical protein